MQGPYADHILDANDVCSNCFSKNRVERVDPVMSSSDFRHELDSHYSRDPKRTTIGFGPSDVPARSKGIFCNCGVEGSFERLWEPKEVSQDKFKELLKSAVRTLREKDVSLREQETIRYAVSHWKEHDDVDRALATALQAGIVAQAASGGRKGARS